MEMVKVNDNQDMDAKESSSGMQLNLERNLSQLRSKKPSSSKRLKRKKAMEESKKENYDESIWETYIDASELYFPIMISENLKNESRKRISTYEYFPEENYPPKLECFNDACSQLTDYEDAPNLDSAEPAPTTIITTGAFTVEGGIADESSSSELPPHTVCIIHCATWSTKAEIREALSYFGEVTDVQLYTLSRPPVAYVTFSTKAASKACVNDGFEELPRRSIFERSRMVRCRQRKITEAEARERCGERQLRFLKNKR